MSAKQVTAQDFVSKLIITQEQGLDEVSALRDFDALLSQARQEARREGRLEGLQEMDIAFTHHQSVMAYGIGGPSGLEKLRQEYSGK